jgi:hypothetical protein
MTQRRGRISKAWASRLRTISIWIFSRVTQSAGLCPVYPAGVGPGQADAGAAAGQIPYQRPGGVAVLDRGRSDHDGRHQPDRVYGDEAHLARARRPGRGAGGRGRGIRRDRRRPVTGGWRARQSPRRRACVRRTRRKLPPATTRLPWSPPLRRVILAALSLRLLPPVLAAHGPGPPGWRAEGAPLKPVHKVATSESEQGELGRTGRAIH